MKKIFLLLFACVAAGCTSVSVHKYYKDVSFPANNPAKIVVFASKPQRPFTEIGEVDVEGASSWSQVERMFRIKAAQIGGDAVYVFTKKEEPRTYVDPHDCHFDYGYYRPYHYGGYRHRYPYHYFPSSYYYCFGYQPVVDTVVFYSAVGIVIKYSSL